MTTYEIIDTICDAVNPILALISIGFMIQFSIKKEFRKLAISLVFFILCVVLVYGLMLLDNRLHIWPKFSSDYSTHTAVCLALCIAIYVYSQRWIFVSIIFLLYCILMLIQKYHTILDIVSTAFVVGFPLLLLARWLRKYFSCLHR